MNRFKIGDINISNVNLNKVILEINNYISNRSYGYICVTNARTVYRSNRDKYYCSIQNNSLFTVPDGMPLVWIANNKGFKDVSKVSGKDLMDKIFEISKSNNYSHYFYGCSQETLVLLQENLKLNYPGIDIKATVSPPFQPIEKFDVNSLALHINTLKPTFFWCGLGAPKQEILMSILQPKLESTMSVGVGLAFEYIAGTVKRAPKIFSDSGLEWVFRLSQQPKNIKRAIKPLTWMFVQLICSFNGKK